jgi:hypothetical protein
MDPEIVEEISEKIYRKFPEVAGIKPKVRKQPVPKNAPKPKTPTYLITFNRNMRGPGGKSIPRWVRVAVTPRGKIIKTTTSR